MLSGVFVSDLKYKGSEESKMKTINIGVSLLLLVTLIQGLSFGATELDARAIEVDEYTIGMDIMNVTAFTFNGNRPYGYFGRSLQTGNGDINGDGLDDLIIGDSQNSTYNPGGGVVNIYFGTPDLDTKMQNITEPDTVIIGESSTFLGNSVCIPGDVNNDGIDDLLISAPWYSDSDHTGIAYLMFGRTGEWDPLINVTKAEVSMISEEFTDYFGMGLCGPGDLNGDGIDDFIIGANYHDSNNGANSGKIYIYFGRSEYWSGNYSATDSDASYIGKNANDFIGSRTIGAGDVNGDGVSDLLCSSPYVDGQTSYDGEAYLIFGKTSGWSHNTSVGSSNAVITGLDSNGYFGYTLAGGYDINSDGIHDIAISATSADGDQTSSGKVMIYFGRTEDWSSIGSSDDADVTISGRTFSGCFGLDITMTRDMNSDGLSDMIIGERDNSDKEDLSGAMFYFWGRSIGWSEVNSTEDADASVHGEKYLDYFGSRFSLVGDMNGDGLEEMMIAAESNDDGGTNAGKIYCISTGRNYEPIQIFDIRAYLDADLTQHAGIIDRAEWIYLELRGMDGNSSFPNTAFVNISLNSTMPTPIKVPLRETGSSTGVYRGRFIVPSSAEFGEHVSVISTNDNSKQCTVEVDTPVLLAAVPEVIETSQYEDFGFTIENLGYAEDVSWVVDMEGSWLSWSEDDLTIKGDPRNIDVGVYDVHISLSHGSGKTDSRDMKIKVRNIIPSITTEDILFIEEDSLYYNDYNCSEDGDGNIQWSYGSNASFLTLDKSSGLLTGEPSSADIGWYHVNIWVTDGNGGKDSHRFNLTVTDRNDAPRIITKDITQISQGEWYYRKYEATDPDPGDSLEWNVTTDAQWLVFEEELVRLSGTPGPEDVGVFDVEVKVMDRGGLYDVHEFKLNVLDVNDAPMIMEAPASFSIGSGEIFSYDVIAFDPDQDSVLTYAISSEPSSDISIGYTNGSISWTASSKWWDEPPFVMEVTIVVEDHELSAEHNFNIEIIPSTPPNTKITSPEDGSKVSPFDLTLSWNGFDLEEDPLVYSIYIGETRAMVDSLKDDTLLISGLLESSMELNDLEPGKTYYWTVIPNDGCSDGSCSSGVNSFKLNKPPEVELPDLQEVLVGEKFRLLIKATDDDQEDWNRLIFSLQKAPDGMTIDEGSGVVVWNPLKGQEQMHQVIVNVTDGTDVMEVTFTIEVLPVQESESVGLLTILIPSVIVMMAIAVILAFLIRKSGKVDKDDQETPVEEQIIGGVEEEEDEPSVKCDVALSPKEAHAHLGKGSKQVSYEDLYGMPTPNAEDGPAPTARELRDQIRNEIKDLEKIEE